MKLTFVDELPKARSGYHNLQALIEEFMNSDCEIARVDLHKNDYKSSNHAYKSIWLSARKSRRLVKVVKRGDDVYLVKTK